MSTFTLHERHKLIAFLETEDAQFIMGRPNFTFGNYAELWRSTGTNIARKAEAEQAFFIGLLLNLAAESPEDWRAQFTREITQREAQRAAQASGPTEEEA